MSPAQNILVMKTLKIFLSDCVLSWTHASEIVEFFLLAADISRNVSRFGKLIWYARNYAFGIGTKCQSE